MYKPILLLVPIFVASIAQTDDIEPAVRVVRFQITYPNAKVSELDNIRKFNSLLRNSVLASLRFINKHWLICGGSELDKKSNDCGKAQVTGEIVDASTYRINATFIAERDPIKNAKVEATSTVLAVIQIGLKGGIFQYTNALKILGKPSQELPFEEAFFCNRGAILFGGDRCRKQLSVVARTRRLRDSVIGESETIGAHHKMHHQAPLAEGKTVQEAPIDLRGLAKL